MCIRDSPRAIGTRGRARAARWGTMASSWAARAVTTTFRAWSPGGSPIGQLFAGAAKFISQ
eukprot:12976315-Alexandrium_andersonii.AAC.1